MPDRVMPADPGLLSSVADEIALPGFMVRNLAKGDPGAASRNLADFLLNIPDAVLPGDLIPEVSGSEDRPEFSDLVGPIDGFAGDLVNFAGNVATDPLTYVPGAALAKVGGAAAKGIKAITPKVIQEGVAKVAKPVGKFIRKTAGAERIGKGLANVITGAQGAKDMVGRAGSDALVEGLKGATPRELEAAGEVLTNITKDKATGALRAIDDTDTLSVQDRLARYLAENQDVDPAKLMQIVDTSGTMAKAQWESGKAAGGPGGNIFTDIATSPDSDVVMGALGGTTGQTGVRDYFPRIFKNESEVDALDRLAQPSAIKGRKLETSQDVLAHLAAHPEISLTTNAAEALSQRAAQQAELASRGATGRGLFGMAREGGMELPDELLLKALAEMPRFTPVINGTAESAKDAALLLGGEAAQSAFPKTYGAFSGVSKPPTLEAVAERAPDVYGIGSFSGASKPPVAGEAADIERLLGNDAGTRAYVDPYGLGSFSGKSKPPKTAPIEDASEASLNAYGLGSVSGKSRPPATTATPLDEVVARNDYGVGSFSGTSKPPSSPILPDATPDPYGVGRQSGKAKPPSSPVLEEVAPDPYGVGRFSGKAVVGKSSNAVTGLTAEEKTKAREWLLSQEYKHADPLMRATAEAIARNLPGDEAEVALHFLKGMEGRKGLARGLAALNSKFKPVAVYGAVVPKLGSITRNMTGGIWQKYSNPEARGTISPKNIPAFMRDWLASIEDGVEKLTGKRLFTKNEFAQMDDAFKASVGDPRQALSLIKDPTMRAAAEKGVFGNNFVDTEGLIMQAGKTGLRKFGADLYSYPGFMFRGAEQRLRYGLFKQLTQQGKSADDAARIVRDSFYDYTQSSVENRLARDSIPFAQFLFKSIPQQAKLMAEKPYLASAVGNAYAQGRDEPVLPQMEGKLNLPFGTDEEGNRQYLSSLGLPFESLSAIPNFSASPLQAGRQIEQNIVGATSPLLKMAYAYTSGRDPMFGTAPGSYQKVAGQDLGRVGGAINQLLGTGLGPAVAAGQLASKVGQFSDPRTSLGELALNQLTGARVQSVDPNRAIEQRLQSLLERDPTIGQFRSFYSKGPDDTNADDLLSALQNAKQAIKAKQKAAMPVN